MSFKKTLTQTLFNLSRISNSTGKPTPVRSELPERITNRVALHQRPLYHYQFLLQQEGLLDFKEARGDHADGMAVRNVARAAEVEVLRTKLRKFPTEWISYKEYVKMCRESCRGNVENGLELAKMLDDSGSVIVLGNSVCLRPHQVAKTIQTLISEPSMNQDDPRRRELKDMEAEKAQIDKKADTLVRRELWAGLGYLVVQTFGFMRLTFWELSWDVMEPICFYVTSFYFMVGYTFFLRTSKEPSFEGFFHRRFVAKQKKIMKANNFDIERYNELRKTFDHHPCNASYHAHRPCLFRL